MCYNNRRIIYLSTITHQISIFLLIIIITICNWSKLCHTFQKTEGKWQVTVITSELPAAGTDSKINITVYGAKGHSGPILLNNENKTHFRSGNEDQFVVMMYM